MTDRKEYRVGRFVLRPHRQLLDGEVPVAIGRKALELLSVLAEAEGELVTKDELMAAVWPKAIVEENAIQVHVAALRKLLGPDAELLSTAHGLGYRLAVSAPATAPERVAVPAYADVPGPGDPWRSPAAAPGVDSRVDVRADRQPPGGTAGPDKIPPSQAEGHPGAAGSGRRRLVIAGAGLAVLAGAAVLGLNLAGFGRPGGDPAVEVERVRVPAGDTAAALFADGLAGDLAHSVLGGPRRIAVAEADTPAALPSDALVLDGEARSVAGRLHAMVQLHDGRDHAIAWSASFDEPIADAALVRQQAAVKIADVLTCVVLGDGGRHLDLETLRLYLHACDIDRDDDAAGKVRDTMRQIVARAPGFSRAWSMLAITSADDAARLPPDQARSARAESLSAAARALELDPHNGQGWVARAMLMTGLADWPRRAADLERARQVDPQNPQAPLFMTGLLVDAGREREALADAQRSALLDPLSPFKAALVARLFGVTGDFGDAQAQIERAARLWPHNDDVRFTRLYLAGWFGQASDARGLLDGSETRPPLSPTELEFWRRVIAARSDPRSSDAAAAFFLAHVGKDLTLPFAIEGLAATGHTNQAFDLAERDPAQLLDATPIFWLPFMASFRASPRFMPLAARLGLTRVWRVTGKWPDFCTAAGAPYDCKARARAAESAPSGVARS